MGVNATVLRTVVAEIEGLRARRALLDADVRACFTRARSAGIELGPLRAVLRRRQMRSEDRLRLDGQIAQLEMALAAGSNRPPPNGTAEAVREDSPVASRTAQRMQHASPKAATPAPAVESAAFQNGHVPTPRRVASANGHATPAPVVGSVVRWHRDKIDHLGRVVGFREGGEVAEISELGPERGQPGTHSTANPTGGRLWRVPASAISVAPDAAEPAPLPERPPRASPEALAAQREQLAAAIAEHHSELSALANNKARIAWLAAHTSASPATRHRALRRVGL